MDFTSLAQGIRGMFPAPTLRGEDGITYGSAQSRWTRDPIRFTTNLSDDTSGFYDSPYKISSMATGFGQPLQKIMRSVDTPSTILVNPLSTDKGAGHPLDVLRHESVHSVMEHALGRENEEMLSELNSKNPQYQKVKEALENHRGGYMPQEAPAYAAQRTQDFGIDPKTRAQYINTMINQLQQVNPAMANAYKRLAGVK